MLPPLLRPPQQQWAAPRATPPLSCSRGAARPACKEIKSRRQMGPTARPSRNFCRSGQGAFRRCSLEGRAGGSAHLSVRAAACLGQWQIVGTHNNVRWLHIAPPCRRAQMCKPPLHLKTVRQEALSNSTSARSQGGLPSDASNRHL